MSGSVARSAVFLALVGVTAKLIGALYRVPLTNTVGAEGMGLYQMVFPLYTVLLAFCGGGMSGAVSRVVAKYTALGDGEAAMRTVRVAFVPLTFVSLVSAGAVALLRNVISGLQGNTDAGLCYLAICPSLLFAGGIAVVRGYFQGRSNMLPSGVSQLIEQVLKLALGLTLAKRLMPFGTKYAVTGALLGVTAGELIAFLYLIIRFAVAKRRRVHILRASTQLAEASAEFSAPRVDDKSLLKELYSFALPVMLGSLVLPLTQMIDSALVINLLMYGGKARGEATALFGLFVGPVGTLVNMPSVVAMSIAIAFLPAITAAVESGGDVAKVTRNAAKWMLLFVIPVTAAFMIFPDRIVRALYTKGLTNAELEQAASLLRVQSPGVFYIGILQLTTAVLQGRNKAHFPVVNLVIGAIVKVALTPVLVRFVGITGAAAATAACYAVAAAATARSACKCGAIALKPLRSFVLPALWTGIGLAVFALVTYLLASSPLSSLVVSCIGAAAFAAVYIPAVAYMLRKE